MRSVKRLHRTTLLGVLVLRWWHRPLVGVPVASALLASGSSMLMHGPILRDEREGRTLW